MIFHFNKKELANFKDNIHREWAVTNGLGGYAGSSILGAHNRTHQGYLIASFHPPVERYLVFSKTNEKIIQSGIAYDLTTAQHKGGVTTEGNQYLESFDYDGTVCFTYKAGDITIKKNIFLVQNENKAAIAYEFINSGDAAAVTITPLMNYREHSESSTPDTLCFKEKKYDMGFSLIPESNPNVSINLLFSKGTLEKRTTLYDIDMELQTEVDNEVDGLDSHYTPYDICFEIPAGETCKFSLICYTVLGETGCDISALEETECELTVSDDTAFNLLDQQKQFIASLVDKAGYKDDFAQALTIASNQFLAHRKSTGYMTVLAGLPWFTDWGRDTMIAYTGLTLATKRFSEARDILLTFAQYVDNGLIPNMFPDNGQAPLYNTADASMWYFYAVDKYLKYTGNQEDYQFIQEKIYPALKQIIEAYKTGTGFSIYMDSDHLIHAGGGLDQVTWMDVRVGDWVPTPRHGKPVEINALWYNALNVMADLAERFGDDASYYQGLASKVKVSFCEKFWNEKDGCLYDVIDDDLNDDSIRPNQIYAVSLPYTMLSAEQNSSILKVVTDKLYAGTGLRSLDPAHKDYHPIYLGSLEKRDHAYHQGTSWGFLLGGFITAFVKVNGASKDTADKALKLLEPVRAHLRENCIGSICEIFDGDAPHYGRGCYAQAWSVGEVLRCYTEDILPYLENK